MPNLTRLALPCFLLGASAACGAAEDDVTRLRDRSQTTSAPEPGVHTLFEADPVRPIAVLERSGWIAVANTPGDALHFFAPRRGSLEQRAVVKVGLRPVAVAVISEDARGAELWVVNHLSDSVSVVRLELADGHAEVIDTLQVGDEPRDIVVATDSTARQRVFVATAHRGQNHPVSSARLAADLITPPAQKQARGLADVLVFDPAQRTAAPEVVNLFSDKPRALAVGNGMVYAASFFSGNRTTAIPAETAVARGVQSLLPLLARAADGGLIEREGELELAAGVAGQAVIEGGQPAVSGQGRCMADPLGDDDVQALCVETDEQQRVLRVLRQSSGAVTSSCQCTSGDGTLQPTTGVIVQLFSDPEACGRAFTRFPDGTQGCWLDAAPGGVSTPAPLTRRQAPPMAWNEQVKFSLPDQDVFAIGVEDLQVHQAFSGVGTVLFGLAVQPGSGRLFATNTDANNLTRFEGHGQSSSTTLIGHLHESRVTVIDPAAAPAEQVLPLHLNTHIDYSRCCDKDPEENAKSFAFPTSGVFSGDGERFFFSALGSDKVGIVNAGALSTGFDQDRSRERGQLREIFLNEDVARPSGPVGLAFDPVRNRLYVKTLFDNQVLMIDAAQEAVTARATLPSPEPASLRRGRSVLYNARLTSSHGDSACASCHVFGDFDGLSWDLGDPEGPTVNNPGPFILSGTKTAAFRSNKGPMATQTLRGLANHGALHWRGDRTRRQQDLPGEQPDFGSLDELESFLEFDVAIQGLNGNDALLEPQVFREFAEFALELTLPPNPIRSLDGTLTPEQSAARALYFGCSSMTDEQLAARVCVGVDGALVALEPATQDCICANNPFVAGLREVPAAEALAAQLRQWLASPEERARLLALVSDTTGLPPERSSEVTRTAAELSDHVAALLEADMTPPAPGLLSGDVAAALAGLSFGLVTVLEVSAESDTPTGPQLAELVFGSLSRLPAEQSRDAGGLVELLLTTGETAAVSGLASDDEAARGTGRFRNLLGGCDPSASASCNLRVTDTIHTCNSCHRLDRAGNAGLGVARPGFFGTAGEYSLEGESQVFKVPHLRNLYQKTGMFGAPLNPFFLPESVLGPRSGGFFAADNQYTGPQVRGFGFFHDGVADTLHRFHGATAFLRSDDDNPTGLDAFLPPAERAPACIERFRAAPAGALASAPEPLRPLLQLCVASGPLPESCFAAPEAEDCQAALSSLEEALGVPGLARDFGPGILPACFQLGSMLEGGAADGDCYPSGLVERAQMESYMLAFDSNLMPMVGQQLTLSRLDEASARLQALLTAAQRRDCDLALHQATRAFLVVQPDPVAPGRSVLEDRRGRTRTLAALWEEATPRARSATFTCHPPSADLAEARRAAFAPLDR